MASSRLSEDAEGAVAPLFVQAVENGIDDVVDALEIDKADHVQIVATDLHKAAFDTIDGAFSLGAPREAEESQQLRQVFPQAAHHARIGLSQFQRKGWKARQTRASSRPDGCCAHPALPDCGRGDARGDGYSASCAPSSVGRHRAHFQHCSLTLSIIAKAFP